MRPPACRGSMMENFFAAVDISLATLSAEDGGGAY
jgi:hypothetical protein